MFKRKSLQFLKVQLHWKSWMNHKSEETTYLFHKIKVSWKNGGQATFICARCRLLRVSDHENSTY